MWLNKLGDPETGIPKAEIQISDCGVIDKQRPLIESGDAA